MKAVSVLLLCFALLAPGCKLFNPDEPLPVYIKVEQPVVRVDPNGAFLAPAGARDVWIERGPDVVGVYQAPLVFPFYPGSTSELLIGGGVLSSGMAVQRMRYPFWKPVLASVEGVAPMDTLVLRPEFEYYALDTVVTFPFEEKFEGTSIALTSTLTGSNAVDISRTTLQPYQGSGCGVARFTTAGQELELLSTRAFRLPRSGNNDIWAEVTFRSDIPFSAGLIYEGTSVGVINNNIRFESNLEWRTVYINLNSQVRAIPGDVLFRFFIRASAGGKSGFIYLDNLRLVHYK